MVRSKRSRKGGTATEVALHIIQIAAMISFGFSVLFAKPDWAFTNLVAYFFLLASMGNDLKELLFAPFISCLEKVAMQKQETLATVIRMQYTYRNDVKDRAGRRQAI